MTFDPAKFAAGETTAQGFDPSKFAAGEAQAPTQPEPVSAPQPEQDAQAINEFYNVLPKTSLSAGREALQYKMLHPDLPLDTIVQNLDNLRAAARGKVGPDDWAMLARQHPQLMEVIHRDPAYMHLELGETAALGGVLGGLARYSESFFRGATYGLGSAIGGGFGWIERTVGKLEDLAASGKYNPLRYVLGDPGGDNIWRKWAVQNEESSARWKIHAQVDIQGDSLKDSSHWVRKTAEVVDTTANLVPYAIGQAAVAYATAGQSLAAQTGATLSFNTFMSLGDQYRAAKASGAGEGAALAVSGAGATAVGGLMVASPLSRLSTGFASRTTVAEMSRLAELRAPSLARALMAGLTRAGIDAVGAQVSLGLQQAVAGQVAGEKIWDAPRDFFAGVQDPSMLGFHAVSLATGFGRGMSAYKDSKVLSDFVIYLSDAAEQHQAVREAILGQVARLPASRDTVYFPVERFLEAADRLKRDPRELAVELFGDKGAAYDAATVTGEEHLRIPIEKVESFVRGGLSDDLVAHGRFVPKYPSRDELIAQADKLKADYEAARTKPLGPDDPLYLAASKLAGKDGDVPALVAQVRALKADPEYSWMTHEEILDGLLGRNGMYGIAVEGALPPSPDRLIEMAREHVGSTEWFKEVQDEAQRAKDQEARTAEEAAAKGALLDALRRNDRRFMDAAKDTALAKAKEAADKHPLIQLARKLTTGEGLSAEQAKALRPDGKPYRLSYDEVMSHLGSEHADEIKSRFPRLLGADGPKAMPARDMAAILGYQDGPEGLAGRKFLSDLLDMPDEKAWVKDRVERELDRVYGPDLLSTPQGLMAAALDAVHTPEATQRLLALNRRFQAALGPASLVKSPLDAAAWEAHAERLIGLKSLKEIDPEYFARAEGAAVRAALKAADGDGNVAEAAKLSERALLYHHLYKAAREATDLLGRAHDDLAKRAVSDKRIERLGFADPTPGEDGLNAYQRARKGVMVSLGLIDGSPVENYNFDSVKSLIDRATELGHDGYLSNGLTWDPEVVQKIIDGKAGWENLTPDEVKQAYSFVANVDHLGKALEDARGKRSYDDVAEEFRRYLSNGGIREGKIPVDPNAQTWLDSQGAKGVVNAVSERAGLLSRMLGWSDTAGNRHAEYLLRRLGPKGEALLNGLIDRIAQRNETFLPRYERWKEVYDRTMEQPDIFKPLPGVLADLQPGNSGMLSGDPSKAWVLNLARWWGDATGRKRVLKQFQVTPDNVEKVLSKYLTHEDHANIQAEKELLEKDWFPALAEASLRRTGAPLPKSAAAPYTVEINGERRTYKGGHVTLTYDDRAGAGLDPRRGLALGDQGTFGHDAVAFSRAALETGFLHERSGAPVGMLPDLSGLTQPQTMLDMAHHLAVGDWLLDATDALLNPKSAGYISMYEGPETVRAVEGWLARVATATRGGPERIDPAARESLHAMRAVRSAVVLANVTGKWTIPLAHLPHPFIAASLMHNPVWATKYMLPAYVEGMNALPGYLATGIHDFVERMQAESAYLRQRSHDSPQDIADLYFERRMQAEGGPLSGAAKLGRNVEDLSTIPLRLMDDHFSAVIYNAEKRAALAEGKSESEAVSQAEHNTARAMPNFSVMLRSGFSASHGYQTLISAYMGYFTTVRDLMRSRVFERAEASIRAREQATGEEASPWFRSLEYGKQRAILSMPVVLGLALGTYLKGNGRKEMEDAPEWATANAGYWQREWPSALADMAGGATKETVKAMSELQPGAAYPVERWMEAVGSRKPDLRTSDVLMAPLNDTLTAAGEAFSPRATVTDQLTSANRALAPFIKYPVAPVQNAIGFGFNYDEAMSRMPSSPTAKVAQALNMLVYQQRYGRAARFQAHNPLSDLRDALEAAYQNPPRASAPRPW